MGGVVEEYTRSYTFSNIPAEHLIDQIISIAISKLSVRFIVTIDTISAIISPIIGVTTTTATTSRVVPTTFLSSPLAISERMMFILILILIPILINILILYIRGLSSVEISIVLKLVIICPVKVCSIKPRGRWRCRSS